MMRRMIVALAIGLLAMPASAFAYLQFSFDLGDGRAATVKWGESPVRWYVTDRGAGAVTAGQFQSAMSAAFQTWEDVPTASIAFQYGGLTTAGPFEDDTLSVLGFQDEPDLDRVLGATTYVVDELTGEIVESDIFFNSAFDWSTAANGETGRFDLQSVATHEIGHLAGLGHSALGETELRPSGRVVLGTSSVMFPIAFGTGNIADRMLQPDDIAGISDLYPAAGFRAATGAIRGRVRMNGHGVLGAHVVAFDLATGDLIGGFSTTDEGDFEIAGLTPGAHVIRVEPVDDGDVESFFDPDGVDTNFRVAFATKLFVAPAGGVGEHLDITVVPK